MKSSKNNLIVGGILLSCVAILMPCWVQGVELGGWIDPDSVRFYTDSNYNVRLHFKVDTTFTINYDLVPFTQNWCDELNDIEWWFRSSSFIGGYARFIQNLDVPKVEECSDASETYTAGQEYDVFLYHHRGDLWFKFDPDGFVAGNPGMLLRDYPICQQLQYCPLITLYYGWFHLNNVNYSADYFYWQESPSITINYPADEAEVTSAFTMEIDFNIADGYERLMILFEDWDASSTCPLPGSEAWDEEYSEYFHYQSFPYFSPFFTVTSGITTIDVDSLNAGTYNCVRCYFINESTGQATDELCTEYDLSVAEYIPPADLPEFYLPIPSWLDYYAEHSERFTTSTPLFINWAGTIEPLISWVGNIALFFQQYFDPDVARAKGEDMGNAVAIARGYLESIDDFFGGLPLSTVFLFYLITALVVIVYRIVKGILTIIVP